MNLVITNSCVSLIDLIFILLDEPDEDRDQLISEHIMGFTEYGRTSGSSSSSSSSSKRPRLERDVGNGDDQSGDERTLAQRLRQQIRRLLSLLACNPQLKLLSSEQFRRYIEYAKKYVHPRLSKAAAKVLQKMYLTMRADCNNGSSKNVSLFLYICLFLPRFLQLAYLSLFLCCLYIYLSIYLRQITLNISSILHFFFSFCFYLFQHRISLSPRDTSRV
jgi:hypothetical protein